MLDLSHIPDSQQDIKIFYAISGSNSWQTWTKPRKCQWVWIMAIGGGGGGFGGGGLITNAGGGGGSGAVTRATFNASHLPDTLFIQVGLGGAGGGPATSGDAGTKSTVSILPNTTSTNGVLSSGNTAAAGGTQAGTTSGETAFTIGTSAFSTLSTFTSVAGLAQTTVNGYASGIDITPLTSQITCPGASGAGMSFNPGAINARSILATTISPLIAGGSGSAAPATNGGDGGHGYTSWKPFFSLGGAGGGNSVSGSGGRGGDGGIGSGGGAGGARANAAFGTTGRGGNGGDGLVVIVAF